MKKSYNYQHRQTYCEVTDSQELLTHSISGISDSRTTSLTTGPGPGPAPRAQGPLGPARPMLSESRYRHKLLHQSPPTTSFCVFQSTFQARLGYKRPCTTATQTLQVHRGDTESPKESHKEAQQNDLGLEGLQTSTRGVVVRRDRAVGPDFFSQIQVCSASQFLHSMQAICKDVCGYLHGPFPAAYNSLQMQHIVDYLKKYIYIYRFGHFFKL